MWQPITQPLSMTMNRSPRAGYGARLGLSGDSVPVDDSLLDSDVCIIKFISSIPRVLHIDSIDIWWAKQKLI